MGVGEGSVARCGIDSSAYEANVRKFYAYRFCINFQFFIPIGIFYLIEERGLNLTTIALLETFFSITALSAEIPTGAVADRFGRRKSMLLGAVVLAAALVIFGTANTFPLLALSYIIWALARTLESGADSAFLYDTLAAQGRSDDFARTIGRAQATWLVAGMLAALIGAPLAAITSLQLVIVLGSLSALAGAAVVFTFVEPPRQEAEQRLPYVQTMKEAARFTLNHAQIRTTAALSAVLLGLGFTVYSFIQPLLRENDVPLAAFAFFTGPPQLVAVLGSLLAYRVGMRLRERNFFYLSAGGITLTLVLVGVLPSLLPFLMFPIFRLWTSMFNPVAQFYINNRTPTRIRATVISVTAMTEGLMLAILGPLVGLTADQTSIRTAFLVVGAAVGVLAVITLWFWNRADRGESPALEATPNSASA